MKVTVVSILTSTLWSSVLVIIICLCRKTRFWTYRFGVMSLALLYLFCVMRMMLPLDFTFTRGIQSEGIYSVIYERIVLDGIGSSGISVMSVLFFLWCVVALVLIVRFAHRYHVTMKKISTYSIRRDEQCRKVFSYIIRNSKKQIKVKIRKSRDVSVPMGIGIFRKSIVLPDEIYSDKELYCILMHEYTHFLNMDLQVKMLVHIFCYIFWWNPVVYLLKKDLSQTLEIKCDLNVTGQRGKSERADYLETISSVLKNINNKEESFKPCNIAGIVSGNCEAEILERFKIVSQSHKPGVKDKIFTAVYIIIFLAVFVFSYSFVVLPAYHPLIDEIETEPETQELQSDNTYILKGEDGIYTVVMPDGVRQDIDEKAALQMEKHGFKIIEEGGEN